MFDVSLSKRKTRIGNEGYLLIYLPEHPKSFDNGWYYYHRVLVEHSKNRFLNNWETIHHINENKQDNRLENLFVCTQYQHQKAHKS